VTCNKICCCIDQPVHAKVEIIKMFNCLLTMIFSQLIMSKLIKSEYRIYSISVLLVR